MRPKRYSISNWLALPPKMWKYRTPSWYQLLRPRHFSFRGCTTLKFMAWYLELPYKWNLPMTFPSHHSSVSKKGMILLLPRDCSDKGNLLQFLELEKPLHCQSHRTTLMHSASVHLAYHRPHIHGLKIVLSFTFTDDKNDLYTEVIRSPRSHGSFTMVSCFSSFFHGLGPSVFQMFTIFWDNELLQELLAHSIVRQSLLRVWPLVSEPCCSLRSFKDLWRVGGQDSHDGFLVCSFLPSMILHALQCFNRSPGKRSPWFLLSGLDHSDSSLIALNIARHPYVCWR